MIHKPGKKKSNIPVGNPQNVILEEKISNNILITTEIWDQAIHQPWNFKGTSTSSTIFKLVMKWEVGKNYAITKIVDESDNLIYFYCDICSSIKSSSGIFEFHDWYLDIIKKPNQKPFLDDEEEFEEALSLGYLSQKEGKLAKETANKLMDLLQNANPIY